MIPLLWRTGFGKAVLFCAAASFCIEILQLPLIRVTDIDDVILNTLGGLAGVLIYVAAVRLWPRLGERFKLAKKAVET